MEGERRDAPQSSREVGHVGAGLVSAVDQRWHVVSTGDDKAAGGALADGFGTRSDGKSADEQQAGVEQLVREQVNRDQVCG